ncbi:MAG: transglutaminase domain-containing protein, partial [Planctomycetota bacterium]
MPHRRSRSSFIRAVLIGRLPGFFAPGVVILMLTLGCIGSPMADAAPVTASEAAALTYDELRAEAGDEFEARVEEGLRRAGGNRTAVESFLATARESGDARRLIAAEFLVANMPTVDLVSMSSEHLKENLDLAFSAWDTLPWAQDVPMNLFLHYVLPHRVTQEPFEPWRAEIYTELASALAKCDNMVDAAVAVNYWCGARVGFKQTEFRDQNINSTIKAGYGRCEEMMIVAIAAMRAMGIPARACSAPWWVTTDNNHAWVEVWADGHWYYTGGCEPRASLDNAWFNGAAQRAGIVVSRMFGDPTMFPTGEVVAIAGRDSAVVNSTAVYARTGEVELVVTDASGEPVADCPVAINAFNFGAFRSLLTGRTDEDGRATFVVGLGDYFYTVGNQRHGRGHAVISTVPGERTTHEFTLQDGAAPPDLVVLNYPTPAEAAEQAALRDKSSGQPKAEYRPELPPNPGIDRFEAGQWTAVDELLDDMAPNDADLWRGIFNDALGNWRAIAEGLLMLPEAHHDDALALMQQTTRLDRLEITPETIVDHIAGVATLSARETVPAERFRRYVLNPRVDIEHITGWRGKVGAFARSNFTADSTEATVEALNRWTAESLASVGRSALGPTMNPGQVLISGHAEDRERAIVAVGALRSLGIPARKEATRNLVEYHDGEQWHSFDPKRAPAEDALAADSASPAGPEGTATEEDDDAGGDGDTSTASIQSGPGVISLSLSRSGQPVAGNFNGFDISRFGGGRWNSIRGYNSNFDGWTRRITLPAGEYLVTAGVRNSNGDPAVRTQVVRL